MAFRWSTDSTIAAIAVLIGAAGSLTYNAMHYGALNQQVTTVATQQTITDNQVQLILQHEAARDQKLDDMIQRLDRIEKDVKP
jgi:predicted metallo-beta-lactamase superfamily hydrolase